MHYKRSQRGQDLDAPRREYLSAEKSLVKAAIEYADADADDERAFEERRKGVLTAAQAFGEKLSAEAQRLVESSARRRRAAIEGVARARSRGQRWGRPRKIPPHQESAARELAGQLGPCRAARQLGISRKTLWRVCQKASLLTQPRDR